MEPRVLTCRRKRVGSPRLFQRGEGEGEELGMVNEWRTTKEKRCEDASYSNSEGLRE